MRPLLQVAAIGLAGLGVLAGCGGGTGPDEWAGRVCGALAPWRTRIADLNAEAQRQMTGASTPEQARSHLLALLAGGESASETARAAVAAAGTPDVDGGAEVAHRFAASLQGARDAYAHARASIEVLSTQDTTAFYDGVVGVMARLNQEYTASALDPSRLDSLELRRAFDGVEQCQ